MIDNTLCISEGGLKRDVWTTARAAHQPPLTRNIPVSHVVAAVRFTRTALRV
jgi:hypothetical protein